MRVAKLLIWASKAIVLALKVAGVLYFLSLSFEVPYLYTNVKGSGPCPVIYKLWVSTLYNERYENPGVWWDRTVEFTDLPQNVLATSSYDIRVITGYKNDPTRKPDYKDNVALISQVIVNKNIDCKTAIQVTKKEVLGQAAAYHWLLSNVSYVDSVHDTSTQTLLDGLGFLYVETFKDPHRNVTVHWDGWEAPSCNDLYLIQDFWRTHAIVGTGISGIIDKHGCGQYAGLLSMTGINTK